MAQAVVEKLKAVVPEEQIESDSFSGY